MKHFTPFIEAAPKEINLKASKIAEDDFAWIDALTTEKEVYELYSKYDECMNAYLEYTHSLSDYKVKRQEIAESITKKLILAANNTKRSFAGYEDIDIRGIIRVRKYLNYVLILVFTRFCFANLEDKFYYDKAFIDWIEELEKTGIPPLPVNSNDQNNDQIEANAKHKSVLNQKQISFLAYYMQRTKIINQNLSNTKIADGFSVLSGYSKKTIKDGLSDVSGKTIEYKEEVEPIINALETTIKKLKEAKKSLKSKQKKKSKQ